MADASLREVVIAGTPVSLQTKRRTSHDRWKLTVQRAAEMQVPEGEALGGYDHPDLDVALVYFHRGPMDGDLDNIVKPILDGLTGPVWGDDRQIARLVVRRVRLDGLATVLGTLLPERVQDALRDEEEFVYVRALAYTGAEGFP